MTYEEMIAACEAGGHDMTEARKNLTTKAAPAKRNDAVLITLDIDDVASVIDEVVARVEVLEASNAELEARLQTLESELAKFARPRAVA